MTQGCKPNTDEAYIKGIVSEIKDHAGLDVVALQEVYRRQATELLEELDGHLGPNPSLYFVETLRCDGFINNYGIAIISRYPFLEGSKERVRLCRSVFDRVPSLKGRSPCPSARGRSRACWRGSSSGWMAAPYTYTTRTSRRGATHRAMADLIIRQVVKDRPDRAVLLGDFYMGDGGAAYRMIGREFRDAWLGATRDERKDCDGNGSTHKTLPKPTQREDYVFVGDGFRVDGARVTCTEELLKAFNLTRRSHNVVLRVPDHLPLTFRLALAF